MLDKVAAAHQYFLSRIATARNPALGGDGIHIFNESEGSYRRLTGKDTSFSSGGLSGGRYDNSPRAELDKETDLKQITRTSKLTGSALFVLTFEPGKPLQAKYLNGDKGFQGMEGALRTVPVHPSFPEGSKARILREIRLVCTPYAGCDGYLLLPSSVVMPSRSIVHDITLPNAPGSAKTVRIEVQQ